MFTTWLYCCSTLTWYRRSFVVGELIDTSVTWSAARSGRSTVASWFSMFMRRRNAPVGMLIVSESKSEVVPVLAWTTDAQAGTIPFAPFGRITLCRSISSCISRCVPITRWRV